METKFNFNSQVCTSKVQSERLLSLGLKKETADMCSVIDLVSNNGKTIEEVDTIFAFTPDDWDDFGRHVTPRWSLHKLLSLLPKYIRVRKESFGRFRWTTLELAIDAEFVVWYREDIDNSEVDENFYAEDIYTSLCDCIEWTIKEGHFNKEYLENGNN